jgi:UDP-4-amino-4,6-dideoxy-N-acetyl-beta-L-altrosamine transaminase
VIPYGRQNISDADISSVVDVLRSDFLTQGPCVPKFEESVASACGAAHAVAVNSATSALHIACLALDVGPGDRVWTSPNTFVASANCALYCGASVDFVDIDPNTYNLSVKVLAAKLEDAERHGKLPKVVIPVHFAGQSCEMEDIFSLAQRYGFRIIEDASHAIGGAYRAAPIGNCAHSDITVFSFHPVKIITTGEGGMAVTNNPELAHRMKRLRTHGVTRERDQFAGISDGPWYYEQLDLGLNYRMTDLQAALGSRQHRRLDEFIARRRKIVETYNALLVNLPLVLPFQSATTSSAFHLYVVKVIPEAAPVTRRQLFDQLRAKEIGVNVHYIPVHMQPYYQRMGFRPGQYPEAERYYANAMSLPIYAALKDSEISYIAETLNGVLLQ